MTRIPLAGILLAAALSVSAIAAPRVEPMRDVPAATFRAPDLAAHATLAIPTALPKAAAVEEEPGGRLRVATVRALAKSKAIEQWQPIAGGFATRFDASSAGAEGLRVKLDVSALQSALEVRVAGSDGRIESMVVRPGTREAWTPWTEGEAQSIELFAATPASVSVGSILHFTVSPFAKAAGSCTVPTQCTTNDAVLDAAIRDAKRASMKITFVEGGSGFLCSGTLIDSARGSPFVLTANHCVGAHDVAGTVSSFWFYEHTTCDALAGINPAQVQLAGGMDLVFTNANPDSTLLVMRGPPPANAVYARLDPALLPIGAQVTSLSHPQGDTSRLALGAYTNPVRVFSRPQDMYGITFSRGIIQGGSSGSGLFTLSGGELRMRGVLSATTIRNGSGMSCTNTNELALYGRLEIFHPQITQFLNTAARPSDDAPNRIDDFSGPVEAAAANIEQRSSPLAFDGRRIDYAGDVDLYRFTLSTSAVVSAWTEGVNLDTIGNILDAEGNSLEANDDSQVADNHFGITRRLVPGTYYVQVGHWVPGETGSYNLRIRADVVDNTNHTSLWWNAAEPGWGLNVNHQGAKVFATLFTYDATGPMWLVMSDSTRLSEGVYEGTLYRTTGPAFNAAPFPSTVQATSVGTMRLVFAGYNGATVTYTVNGAQVTKTLSRQEFGTVPDCTWSAFDRSFSGSYQDLWYTPLEPGWGVNIAHQGEKIFATLFTYDATGRGLWLVMSDGVAGATGFSGPLYRTTGPVFNASPWTPATATQVGTMSFNPNAEDSNAATLTYTLNGMQVVKQVQRQVFSTPKPACD